MTEPTAVVLPPGYELIPTGPTHTLVIPVDAVTFDELREIADQARQRLPYWVSAVFVPMMRGNAVLLPNNRPTGPA